MIDDIYRIVEKKFNKPKWTLKSTAQRHKLPHLPQITLEFYFKNTVATVFGSPETQLCACLYLILSREKVDASFPITSHLLNNCVLTKSMGNISRATNSVQPEFSESHHNFIVEMRLTHLKQRMKSEQRV